jgi:DNA-binding NarL/FixJ family response regulator
MLPGMTSDVPRHDINVLIVEDHPALREGVQLLLQRFNCRVVGSAGDLEMGVRLYGLRRPDVVITDYSLGDDRGTELIERLTDIDPGARVIVYTGHVDAATHAQIHAAGARGLVLKGSDMRLLVDAVWAVAAGGTYIDRIAQQRPPARVLTRRQGEILELLAGGYTGKEAAAKLVLAPETVRTHVRDAMLRLGARTRAQAVIRAAQMREISAEQ